MSERLAWTGVVLAGGRSRRFGGTCKARLPLGGRTLLQQSLCVLRPVTQEQLVVGGDPRDTSDATLVVPDRYPDAGPLGGLITAVRAARTTHVLVVACDLPFLTAPFLAALQRTGARAPLGVVFTPEQRMALCLTVRRDVDLGGAWDRGVRRMQALPGLLEHAVMPADEVARYDTAGRLLMNVNDPLTYARALAEAEHD